MKTGIHYWFGYPIENKQRFELIKVAGFDSIMLQWSDEYKNIDGNKEELPDLARKSGLEIDNIHLPYKHINEIWKDSMAASEVLGLYKNYIDDAKMHKIPMVIMHATNGKKPPPINTLGIERFKQLADYAGLHGIKIALENNENPRCLDDLFEQIKNPYLGFCYDSGHENCYSKNVGFIQKYGHRLFALHLHDNDGMEDQHRIPGEGTVNWDTVKRDLHNSAYRGTLTLEVTNEFSLQYTDLNAVDFLKAAYEKTKTIFA